MVLDYGSRYIDRSSCFTLLCSNVKSSIENRVKRIQRKRKEREILNERFSLETVVVANIVD